MPASSRLRVTQAKLIGAYARRQDLEHWGKPTGEADGPIVELEALLPADAVERSREVAARGQPMVLGDGGGGHAVER